MLLSLKFLLGLVNPNPFFSFFYCSGHINTEKAIHIVQKLSSNLYPAYMVYFKGFEQSYPTFGLLALQHSDEISYLEVEGILNMRSSGQTHGIYVV